MTDSKERRSPDQENVVTCAGGYILRKREWSDRGEECLGEEARTRLPARPGTAI